MLVQLGGRFLRALSGVSRTPFIGRICDSAVDLPDDRSRDILLVRGRPSEVPAGFRAYFFHEPPARVATTDAYVVAPAMRYLEHGDVVRVEPHRGEAHALYRRSSRSNSLLVTERCDNFCLMCSQPPKTRDDDWIVDELLSAIPLFSPDTAELGITGGEPALLGSRLATLIDTLERTLPRTSVHVLSNGRAFAEEAFAAEIARVHHHDLMLGIPLYSSVAEEHDYVVQARGAFGETVRGILNLKRRGVRVEVRVVIHADTFRGLPDLAEFISRNLLFVDHVALMGLEPTGFAKKNFESLWVDPVDYAAQLRAAVETLSRAGMAVSIYNHQICVIPAELAPFARKSISDWKNDYPSDCDGCGSREACGGFFASSGATRRSRGIAPMPPATGS